MLQGHCGITSPMDCRDTTALNDLELMLLDKTVEPKALPLSLLEDITNGFSADREIGRGGYAVVYKGVLENGTVAVKRLTNMYMDEKKFHGEVECLMKARHKNIIRFLGYCADTQGNMMSYNGKLVFADVRQRFLCFEYMSKGSLRDYISESCRLEWRTCCQIINGICQGLNYLHENRIVHLDLKPENVLLDDNMVPKITDFGLSWCFEERQTSQSITSQLCGTLGYIAPELYSGKKKSSKSDIFSLGIIIIEILTGQKGYPDVEAVLTSWCDRLENPLEGTQLKQLRVCTEIGIECSEFNPAKRPASTQNIIERIKEIETTDEVYSVTKLLEDHPEGDNVLLDLTTQNATDDFEEVGHGSVAQAMMDEYYTGEIDATTVPIGRKSIPPMLSNYKAYDIGEYDDGESSISSESISTFLSSLEMNDQVTELKALESVLIDANAEPIRLSYSFIRYITGNFSQEIGRGGFGVVYLGNLGTVKIAVKKLSIAQGFSDALFVGEIKCLIRTKHNNVVRFLGYCADTHGELVPFNRSYVLAEVPQRLLCFEYVPNGNLQKYLKDKARKDDWQIRYQMIRGICHGLNYLHNQRITHLDLKPDNILLDACLEPKITDFGLSRCFDEGISRVYTKIVRGTPGSIAPEIIDNGEITFKSDIYGLGIIIIKLLTGCDNYDFENWHTSLDVDDPQVKSCIEIAQICVAFNQHERPTIGEIMQKLDEIEIP